MKPRVVVTGLGVVCPVGNDQESAWDSLINGRSGIGPITHFDASDLTTRFAGEVSDQVDQFTVKIPYLDLPGEIVFLE